MSAKNLSLNYCYFGYLIYGNYFVNYSTVSISQRAILSYIKNLRQKSRAWYITNCYKDLIQAIGHKAV